MSEQNEAALKVTLKIKAFFIGVLGFFKLFIDYLIRITALTIAGIAILIVMGMIYHLETGDRLDSSVSITYTVP